MSTTPSTKEILSIIARHSKTDETIQKIYDTFVQKKSVSKAGVAQCYTILVNTGHYHDAKPLNAWITLKQSIIKVTKLSTTLYLFKSELPPQAVVLSFKQHDFPFTTTITENGVVATRSASSQETRFLLYLLDEYAVKNNISKDVVYQNKTSLLPFTEEEYTVFVEKHEKIVYNTQDNVFTLKVPYAERHRASAIGMLYSNKYKKHAAPAYKIHWESSSIVQFLSDDTEPEIKHILQTFEKRKTVKAIAKTSDLQPTLDGLTDKPHQTQALDWLLSQLTNKGCILQHEMGLGKTRTALRFAQLYKDVHTDTKIVVICPAGVITQWLRTAMGIPIVIEVYSWQNIPAFITGSYLLIVDESHKTQNIETKQTQNALRCGYYADFVLCLTGTACPNGRPKELVGQLMLCRVPVAFNYAQFVNTYEAERASLEFVLADVCSTLKVSDVYNENQPNINYCQHSFTKDQRELLDAVFDSMMSDFFDRVMDGAVSIGGQQFVKLTAIRLANSMAKVNTTLTRVYEICETRPVVVFTDFAVSANELYSSLTGNKATFEDEEEDLKYAAVLGSNVLQPSAGATVLGGTRRMLDPRMVSFYSSNLNTAQRDKVKQDFVSGKTNVFIATYKTGGTALDGLQERNPIVILHDLSWIPGVVDQAIYRVHRLAKHGFNIATVEAILGHSIDKRVYRSLVEKRVTIKEMGL